MQENYEEQREELGPVAVETGGRFGGETRRRADTAAGAETRSAGGEAGGQQEPAAPAGREHRIPQVGGGCRQKCAPRHRPIGHDSRQYLL